jgi:histidine triad (HIT) family protein
MSSCLFCDMVAGKVPCQEVHRDDDFLAFRDIAPQAPTHILIIPRRHVVSIAELEDDDRDLAGALLLLARRLAAAEGLDGSGYRCVLNSGADGGQSVFHLHLHLLGGRPMTWPPG